MKALFFSPYADIWGHAFPEALIAESLIKAGHHVLYVGCGKKLDRFCVPMAAHGMTAMTAASERYRVCQRCCEHDSLIRKKFGFEGPLLSELVDDGMVREADEILSVSDQRVLIDLEIEGVQIGKIALYQLMLRTKRLEMDLSQEELSDYVVELRNTIYAWQAGKKLLDLEKPDCVVVYNAMYSTNRVICQLAERRGIPHYFLHAGGNLFNRLQTLWIGRGDTFSFFPHLLQQWPRFSEIPCHIEDLSMVTEHYIELLRGRSTFVYSKPKSAVYKDIRKHFGVTSEQKLLVATLSSYDEERAAEIVGARVHVTPLLFETQIRWVQSLISYARSRPDIFLIVRVHPREFPNKRESILSHHAVQLKEVLTNLPSNVVANWPDDDISMYDLADQTDVFLNSWSSVGKEMALLGIPVVLYAPDMAFYPAGLGYVATTEAGYFEAIEQALADGWSFERIRRAFRWHVFEFIRATVFIGDGYAKLSGHNRSFGQRLVEQLDRRLRPGLEQAWDCARRPDTLSSFEQIHSFFESQVRSVVDLMDAEKVRQVTLEVETAALEREILRIAKALYPNETSRGQSRLYRELCGATRHATVVAS